MLRFSIQRRLQNAGQATAFHEREPLQISFLDVLGVLGMPARCWREISLHLKYGLGLSDEMIADAQATIASSLTANFEVDVDPAILTAFSLFAIVMPEQELSDLSIGQFRSIAS